MIIMNRNTSPVSPFTETDYKKAYQMTEENQYPEAEIRRFKENYSRLNPSFSPEQIELANGADEWIQKLMITFGQEGVLLLNPDFFMYQEYANQLNCPIEYIDANEDFVFSLADILDAIERVRPKLFILSNPHNPTGVQFREEALQTLADAVEAIDGYFVIDEAYVEFGQDYKRPTGDHIIVLRTMSKIYGMAGLRLGVVYATGETYDKLTRINHPYPINALTLNLANTFLENDEKVEEFVSYQLKSKQALDRAFNLVAEKINVFPSEANFVFTTGDLAINLGEYLKENGFLGRFYQENELKDVVRYSIIELEHYPLLEKTLENWRNSLDT